MTVQQLADLLQVTLGLEILNGQLCLHFSEGRVQAVEHKGFYRLPPRKDLDKPGPSAHA